MAMGNVSEIKTALDERHAAARAAFAHRDIPAYAEMFCAVLQYRQADGIVSRLMRNVTTRFIP